MSTTEHEMLHDMTDEGGWEVGCSCGWGDGNPWLRSYEECVEAFDNHCDVVFMEATMQGAPDA